MSSKSDLFFKALAGKKAKMPPLDRFAEGGEAEAPEPMEAPENDTSVSDDEKLAAYEILEVVNGGPGGDSKSRAERLAKALKAFFLIVDSKPHDEGGMPPESGMAEPGPF